MYKILLLTLFCAGLIFISSCGKKEQPMLTADQQFEQLSKDFLSEYFQSSPISATWIGIHDYDHLLDDVSAEGMSKDLARIKKYKALLDSIDVSHLNKTNSIDARILAENLNEGIFGYEELREFEWNPMGYTGAIGNAIMTLVTQEFAPLDTRLNNAIERAKLVPAFLANAKKNLKIAPKIHVETAIMQNGGNVTIFREELPKAAANSSQEIQSQIKEHGEKASIALEEFGKWLQEDLLPRATKDFRLGKEMFAKKLRHTLKSTMTTDEVVMRAEAEKRRVQQEMFALAAPLYKEYYKKDAVKEKDSLKVIKMVLDKIVLDHCKKEEVMEKIKAMMPAIENFVKEKDLLTLDATQPLVIRETPEYQRGVAVASLESPGPLEKNLKTFYNVTPIPAEWTPQQVESYLREYNTWSLYDLSIHEGIPGHYVQLYYSNRFPSILRTLMGSGVMIEGWAVYAERMMVEAGFMNNDPRMQLINMKWYIRAVCNTILDNNIHAGTMSEQQAMDLMMHDAFQEEREAAGKWRRANLTSTQLSTYFVGYQEIMDLRNDYKEKMGEKFNLKQFHETFLSFGSPSVKYIREMMME